MLGTFREKVVKWGAQLLFAMLLLSFIGWGIGDYLGYSAGARFRQGVATVGSREISTADFQREVQDQVARLRQMFGPSFNMDQAKAMGIADNVLQSMIQENLIAEGARKMGLVVDDKVVSAAIREDDQFKGAGGDFDRLKFQDALRQLGLSEGQYVQLLRSEMLRTEYLSPISISPSAPETLIEAIYRYRNEKRVASILTLPFSAVTDIPEPSQDDLQAYYDAHKTEFTLPEQRKLTVVRIRPADLVDEIEVTEGQMRTYYEDHAPEFGTPEKRNVQQIIVNDEDTAKKLHDRIAGGEDFTAVGKSAGNTEETMNLGTLTRDEVPLPELGEAAFSLDQGKVSDPVKTALGWHLVRASEIVPATQKSFDEVKDQIRKRLALDAASDQLYKISTKLEDEIGGGASLEEAAQKLKFNLLKVDGVDSSGRDSDGNRVDGMSPEILRTAFSTPEGGDSGMEDLAQGAGYFMLHVDKVTPAALEPLDKVKDRVVAGWKTDARTKKAGETAQAMVEDLKAGKPIAEVAQTYKAQVTTSPPFTRSRQGAENTPALSGALVSSLFKAKPGTPVAAPGPESYAVGVVGQVIAADPSQDTDGLKALKQELSQAVANDLSDSLTAALRERFRVSIDRDAVDQAF